MPDFCWCNIADICSGGPHSLIKLRYRTITRTKTFLTSSKKNVETLVLPGAAAAATSNLIHALIKGIPPFEEALYVCGFPMKLRCSHHVQNHMIFSPLALRKPFLQISSSRPLIAGSFPPRGVNCMFWTTLWAIDGRLLHVCNSGSGGGAAD